MSPDMGVREQHRQAPQRARPVGRAGAVPGHRRRGAAVEFAAFLKVWRELPHPRAIVNDPENADIPNNASALMALCGALYKLASDINFDAIVTLRKLWEQCPWAHTRDAHPA